MKKKIYEKPSTTVIKIQPQHIVCTSPSDPIPPDSPEYGDWLG